MQEFHSHALGATDDGTSKIERGPFERIARNDKFIGNLNLLFEFLFDLLQPLYMCNRHAETHLFVVFGWRCQFSHQQVEFLLNMVNNLFHSGVLRHRTSQTKRRCCLVNGAKSIGAWVIFRDALVAQQAGIASIACASSYLCHISALLSQKWNFMKHDSGMLG